ncbi:putative Fe-Mo cluster-binding NifX family protein [Desulfitispora alkaliphila]|uniref:NifB/NifX family molybdenum-iron cluster-binding protein n=1 Tax=Desulfitispora alkaliphila TaxID=622674 RepID=UPI003D1CDAA8
MSKIKVAVPSEAPGGLEALRAQHFGKCQVFTLVELENDQVVSVTPFANTGHTAGGCLEPVKMLADQGVQAIIVTGMGKKPLMGFRAVNIDVYLGQGVRVEDAVNGYIKKELEVMSEKYVCGSHASCDN